MKICHSEFQNLKQVQIDKTLTLQTARFLSALYVYVYFLTAFLLIVLPLDNSILAI